jgi:hypothetical protein
VAWFRDNVPNFSCPEFFGIDIQLPISYRTVSDVDTLK